MSAREFMFMFEVMAARCNGGARQEPRRSRRFALHQVLVLLYHDYEARTASSELRVAVRAAAMVMSVHLLQMAYLHLLP